MEENILPTTFPLQIDNGNISYLSEAAKWGKFLAILGFVLCALIVLAGFFAGTLLSSLMQSDSELSSLGSMGSGIFTVVYVIIGLLYFFPSLYLFNFASKMQAALRNNDQINLNTSFKNLKSCFKFWGIFFIILLCFYAIIIIFAIIGGTLIH